MRGSAGDELRAIKRYLASRTDKLPWLFVSERGQPFTRSGVNYLVRTAGDSAGLTNVYPHMLRLSRPGEESRRPAFDNHGEAAA